MPQCIINNKYITQQECIPVGCVPSAAAAISWGRGVLPGGVCFSGGLCFLGRGCVSQGGVLPGGCASEGYVLPRGCAPWGGGCASQGGVLPRGDVLPRGWWCASRGGVVSQHALRQTPPVNRMTDRCKNITFATSLQTVKIEQLPLWSHDLSGGSASRRGKGSLPPWGRILISSGSNWSGRYASYWNAFLLLYYYDLQHGLEFGCNWEAWPDRNVKLIIDLNTLEITITITLS